MGLVSDQVERFQTRKVGQLGVELLNVDVVAENERLEAGASPEEAIKPLVIFGRKGAAEVEQGGTDAKMRVKQVMIESVAFHAKMLEIGAGDGSGEGCGKGALRREVIQSDHQGAEVGVFRQLGEQVLDQRRVFRRRKDIQSTAPLQVEYSHHGFVGKVFRKV